MDKQSLSAKKITDKTNIAVSTYEKIAGIYTKTYFNDLSDTPYIDKFLKFLPEKTKVLEVGSGPGQFVKYLLDKGYNAQGIDMSEKMINIAKKKVPNGKFDLMDMRKLKFPSETFDGLMALYSLIHTGSEEIPSTLKGFERVLKKNGYLLIIAQKGAADRITPEPFDPKEKMFVNFFTKQRLSKFVRDAGFKIHYIEELNSGDPTSMSSKIICLIAQKENKF